MNSALLLIIAGVMVPPKPHRSAGPPATSSVPLRTALRKYPGEPLKPIAASFVNGTGGGISL